MSDWTDDAMRRRSEGERRTFTQDQHAQINTRHFPGTRQLCSECDSPTGRCEDDSLFIEDDGPLCEECWFRLNPEHEENERAK